MNSEELIRKGIVGMYNNAMVKLSNGLPKSGSDDCMVIRTKEEKTRAASFTTGFAPALDVAAIRAADSYAEKKQKAILIE